MLRRTHGWRGGAAGKGLVGRPHVSVGRGAKQAATPSVAVC